MKPMSLSNIPCCQRWTSAPPPTILKGGGQRGEIQHRSCVNIHPTIQQISHITESQTTSRIQHNLSSFNYECFSRSSNETNVPVQYPLLPAMDNSPSNNPQEGQRGGFNVGFVSLMEF
ncbi:hypothetical protein CDAR_2041 [Caerostris darwini]|uniref:Uncharacterized protein n=1 Tax=Caerostris darwini TaxID=1538125 RepID=A0AAV4VYM9_9ARAC|nr:hypothetical protein CDAR_2041 [Caerostris darwini]